MTDRDLLLSLIRRTPILAIDRAKAQAEHDDTALDYADAVAVWRSEASAVMHAMNAEGDGGAKVGPSGGCGPNGGPSSELVSAENSMHGAHGGAILREAERRAALTDAGRNG